MTPDVSSGLERKKRILKNTGANGVAQVAVMVSAFIFLPLLIGSFGTSVYGIYALYLAVAGYAVLLDLGVGPTLTRLVAEHRATGDVIGLRRSFWSAVAIYAVIGAGIAAIMVLLGLAAPALFRLTGAEAELLRILVWMGAAYQLWYWPTIASRDALGGLQRFDLTAGVTLMIVVSDILATIFVIATGQGPIVLVAIRMATGVLASILYFVLLRRSLGAPVGAPRPERKTIASILRSGWSIFVLQVAGVINRQQTDKVILGIFLGTTAVTVYEVGSKIASLIATLIGLSSSATLPVAAELNAADRTESLLSLFFRGSRIIGAVVAPIVVILATMAHPLIRAWLGEGYSEAATVAQILLLAQLFLPIYTLGDHVLIARNRFSIWMRGGLTLALLNIILSSILVRLFGVAGVALGTAITFALEIPWYLAVFGREMGVSAREWFRRTALPTYPLLLVPAVITFALARTPLGTSIPGLFAIGVVAFLAYELLALRLAFTEDERWSLRALVLHAVGRNR